MSTPVDAKIRTTKRAFLVTVPSGALIGVGWFGFGLLFGSALDNGFVLDMELLVVVVPLAFLIAIALFLNQLWFAPTEVWTEEGKLVVRTPKWWFALGEQFRLEVDSVRRADDHLAATGTLSRWWDWNRYEIRIDLREAEALEARLMEIEQR